MDNKEEKNKSLIEIELQHQEHIKGGYFKRNCVYCEIFIGKYMMEGRKFKDRKIKSDKMDKDEKCKNCGHTRKEHYPERYIRGEYLYASPCKKCDCFDFE